MESQLQQLSEAQSLIYSRSNIRRTYSEFDDTDIAGTYLDSNDCLIIVRNDGSQQSYPANTVRKTFADFTTRLPHFFAYLGPNFRGPSIWRNNCYIMHKGWHYQAQGTANLVNAQAQRRWVDKYSLLDSEEKIKAALGSFDLGYLISPDGKTAGYKAPTLADDEVEDDETPQPYCSCGSFQRQSNLADQIRQDIPDFQPSCKHMTWFARYRQFLSARSELIESCRGHMAETATAWYYAPPALGKEHGKLSIIYTKHGQNAPLKMWRHYKAQESFNETDAWDLFDNMLEKGFVPFPHTSLIQIAHAFKAN